MAKYPVSGAVVALPGGASSGADNASTGAVLLMHGTATGTLSSRKRVLWLRSVWFRAVASGMEFGLADASHSATAANIAPYRKFAVPTASYVIGTDASNIAGSIPCGFAKVEFPPPGLKFTTNCLVYVIAGSGATAGSCGGLGYEEG